MPAQQHTRESQLSEIHAREAAAVEARASFEESPTIGDQGTAHAPARAPSGANA